MLFVCLLIPVSYGIANQDVANLPSGVDVEKLKSEIKTGFEYVEKREYQAAERQFRGVLIAAPKNVMAFNGLGLVFFYQNNFSKSMNYFQKAINTDPSHPLAYANIGDIYFHEKNWQKAREWFEKATQRGGDKTARILNNYGLTLVALGEYEKAEQLLTQAVKFKPTAQYYQNLGNAFLMQKKYSQAIYAFSESLNLDSQNVETLSNLGYAHFMNGDRHEGIVYTKIALKINAEYFIARRNLGAFFVMIEKHPEAIRHLKKALRLEANDPGVYADLGLAYAKLNKDKEAKEAFSRALELDPKNENYKNEIKKLTAGKPERV